LPGERMSPSSDEQVLLWVLRGFYESQRPFRKSVLNQAWSFLFSARCPVDSNESNKKCVFMIAISGLLYISSGFSCDPLSLDSTEARKQLVEIGYSVDKDGLTQAVELLDAHAAKLFIPSTPATHAEPLPALLGNNDYFLRRTDATT